MEHLVSVTEVTVLGLCWPLCQDLRCAPRQHKQKALQLTSLLLTLGLEVKWAFSLMFPSSGIWMLGTLRTGGQWRSHGPFLSHSIVYTALELTYFRFLDVEA